MTISEIAKIAGVSSAAVSRYLNGGSLSKEKREIIKKVIEEHNYVPSFSARSLRTKKSRQIGVIIPKINSEAVPRIVSGISSVLNEHGYQFLLADSNNSLEKEIEYLETINNSQMDGVILLGTVITKKHKEILSNLKKPIVIVGQKVSKYACVYHDDKQAAFDMATLILNSNCHKFGYLSVTDKDEAAGKLRTAGVIEALEKKGLTKEDMVRVESNFSIEAGYKSMKELLEKDSLVDGVFCATDAIAIGAMMYLKEIGKKVPEDLRICGIGNHEFSSIISPKLTTAKYYYETSGSEAAKLLMEIIKEKDSNKNLLKQLMLGYEIIYRESI